MPLTVMLPAPLDEEITTEAEREGVAPSEYASLLVCLAAALHEDTPTPFREAVRVFLSSHSLDAEQIGSAVEALLLACLHDRGKVTAAFQEQTASDVGVVADDGIDVSLRSWRNGAVHSPLSQVAPLPEKGNQGGEKTLKGYGRFAGLLPTAEEYMREKQEEVRDEDIATA